MELETLFTVSKWDILTYLSKGKYSPLQLSRQINTSIANVSQQLRLLEFAGIVKKEKVSEREAGKPRTLYFLADDFAYLILIMQNSAAKRLLSLTDYHKIILRIWFIEDLSTHYALMKFVGKIESQLDQIQAILVDTKRPDITVYMVTDAKDLKPQEMQFKDSKGESKTIVVKVLSQKELGSSKLPKEKIAELDVIHDPNGIIKRKY